MFTEEENKIISLFYSGDYELAEQLMIATKNGKLVDKLICKIHKLLYKYKIKHEKIILHSGGCISSWIEGGYKNAVALCCCNMLVNGFLYWEDKNGIYDGRNDIIRMDDSNRYPEGLRAFVYDVGYFDKQKLERELNKLGVRLTIGR
jgi:hypothetical protein